MFKTTMTGSFYRTKEILELLGKSKTGEVSEKNSKEIETAEKLAISDQIHPGGSKYGMTWVSNGEQRKSGYTTYIPNRFAGFSKTKKASTKFSNEFYSELMEANPFMAKVIEETKAFELPAIEQKLEYTGSKQAKREAEDAVKIAKKLGAKRVFVPAPSPGVITVFTKRKVDKITVDAIL